MGGASATEQQQVYDKRWWTLAVLCLSLLIVFVGNSSLNVAIPTLSRVLHASESQLQWVIAVYSLVFAGLLFSTGALGDRFGRKGALQAGLGIYLAGCLLATRSHLIWELIACRGLMGVGASLIMPSTLSILVNVFPPEERSKAIAIWASFTGAAGAIGPVASGFLLGHFWYGSVFLVNAPILTLALVAGRILVPKSRDPEQGRLDPVGAVLSVVGIVSVVYGLIQAPSVGWGSTQTVLAFVCGVVVLVAFVWWELRVDEPMLDIRFFQIPAFSTGTGGMILVFMSMYGVMFLITQYVQLILRYSPLHAALAFLPLAPIMLVVSPMTPRLSARFGAHRTVAGGMLLIAVGLLILRGLTPATSYWYLLLSFMPFNAGLALAMSPMTAAIMSAVPPRRAGAGSATNDATRELGAALGVAVVGSLAATGYGSKIAGVTKGLGPDVRQQARASLAGALNAAQRLPGPARRTLVSGAQRAFLDGIHLAVLVGAALAVSAAVIVVRNLPHQLSHHGAGRGALQAAENAAELGLAGVPPVFADTPDDLGRTDEAGGVENAVPDVTLG